MLIETFTVGMLSTNCYIASDHDTKETIIIDPGLDYTSEAQPIMDYIEQAQLKVKYIINTHGHNDHVKGDAIFQEKYGVPICIHKLDAYFIADPDTANTDAEQLHSASSYADKKQLLREALAKKPTTGESFIEIFSTHPNMIKRLRALQELQEHPSNY